MEKYNFVSENMLKYTNWLLPCLFWLQDMNHPGAEIIAERLKVFSDKYKLLREKEKAVRIAEIIGDEEWF